LNFHSDQSVNLSLIPEFQCVASMKANPISSYWRWNR
jgi:hypothetical protein